MSENNRAAEDSPQTNNSIIHYKPLPNCEHPPHSIASLKNLQYIGSLRSMGGHPRCDQEIAIRLDIDENWNAIVPVSCYTGDPYDPNNTPKPIEIRNPVRQILGDGSAPQTMMHFLFNERLHDHRAKKLFLPQEQRGYGQSNPPPDHFVDCAVFEKNKSYVFFPTTAYVFRNDGPLLPISFTVYAPPALLCTHCSHWRHFLATFPTFSTPSPGQTILPFYAEKETPDTFVATICEDPQLWHVANSYAIENEAFYASVLATEIPALSAETGRDPHVLLQLVYPSSPSSNSLRCGEVCFVNDGNHKGALAVVEGATKKGNNKSRQLPGTFNPTVNAEHISVIVNRDSPILSVKGGLTIIENVHLTRGNLRYQMSLLLGRYKQPAVNNFAVLPENGQIGIILGRVPTDTDLRMDATSWKIRLRDGTEVTKARSQFRLIPDEHKFAVSGRNINFRPSGFLPSTDTPRPRMTDDDNDDDDDDSYQCDLVFPMP